MIPIKILNDVYKIKVVATGSSELRQKAGEDFDTMAGRFQEMYCLPLSIEEIHDYANVDTHDEGLFERNLIKNLSMFGAYPEVYLSKSSESYKIKRLEKIIEAYPGTTFLIHMYREDLDKSMTKLIKILNKRDKKRPEIRTFDFSVRKK